MRCSNVSHYLAGRIIRDKDNLQKKKTEENESVRVAIVRKHGFIFLLE